MQQKIILTWTNRFGNIPPANLFLLDIFRPDSSAQLMDYFNIKCLDITWQYLFVLKIKDYLPSPRVQLARLVLTLSCVALLPNNRIFRIPHFLGWKMSRSSHRSRCRQICILFEKVQDFVNEYKKCKSSHCLRTDPRISLRLPLFETNNVQQINV